MSAVTLHRVDAYDRAQIARVLERALADSGGLDRLLDGRQRILIKPNFVVAAPPEQTATTHPAVYLAVAELLQASGRQVTIGDSPAHGSTQAVLRRHGALEECSRRGIDVLTFRHATPIPGVPGDHHFAELTLAAELADFDAIINLPKLKVHQQVVFTGGTKNLFGCVCGKRKAYRHFATGNNIDRFARMLLANAAAIRPVLTIADGIHSLHGWGPLRGEPYPLHALLVGTDYLAVDWLYCRMIGLEPAETPLFRVLPTAEHRRLEAACTSVVSSPEFRVAEGHRLSPVTPIRFGLVHLCHSVLRSWRAQ